MVTPLHFGFNPQTAITNLFQHQPNNSANHIQKRAQTEFNQMVNLLKKEGINVLILPSPKDSITPDAVFPNNWFSHHEDGKLVIYPMLVQNRRDERQLNKLQSLLLSVNISINNVVNLTDDENQGHALEGTGSLVLDRVVQVAFALASPRTTRRVFDKWCQIMGYQGVFFQAFDGGGLPIYHTNVIMHIGREFTIVCLESIEDVKERKLIKNKLKNLGKELIEINLEQTYKFCGNVLQLKSKEGRSKIVMSQTAYKGFAAQQRKLLNKFGDIIAVNIPTIERVGGGSARCMLAEIFP